MSSHTRRTTGNKPVSVEPSQSYQEPDALDDNPRRIVIIGAGVIGCTTAYYLTRHPRFNPAIHSVTIIEATTIASSASGKAGGLLALWANPSATVPLSFRLHEELAKEHGGFEKWGYRRLDGCGTIKVNLQKGHLQSDQKALLPTTVAYESTSTRASKRRKLNSSETQTGVLPDAPMTGSSPAHLDESPAPKSQDTGSSMETISTTLSAEITGSTSNATTLMHRPCLQCQKRKIRCTRVHPCDMCLKADRRCEFNKSVHSPMASHSRQLAPAKTLPVRQALNASQPPTTATQEPPKDTPVTGPALHNPSIPEPVDTSFNEGRPLNEGRLLNEGRPLNEGRSLNEGRLVVIREMPAILTGRATKWRPHKIYSDGSYWIGDRNTPGSYKVGDGHAVGPAGFGSGSLSGLSLATNVNATLAQINSMTQPEVESLGEPTMTEQARSAMDEDLARRCNNVELTTHDKNVVNTPESSLATTAKIPVKSIDENLDTGVMESKEHPGGRREQRVAGNITLSVRSLRTRPQKKVEKVAANSAAKTWTWQKVPKLNGAAAASLQKTQLPSELDWIDPSLVSEYKQMGTKDMRGTAQVHPHHFTTSMASFAQGKGVLIREGVKVTKINYTSGEAIHSVELLDRDSGEKSLIEDVTDVMVAAGAWTSTLLPKTGIKGVRAHSVVWKVDVSPHAVFTDIKLPRGYIPEHRRKSGRAKHPYRTNPEAYARPYNEVYACGETENDVELPPTSDLVQVDQDQCDDLVTYMGLVSPALRTAPVTHRQACFMPHRVSEDGHVFGRTLTPGLWVAAGHSCWGIQHAPACGILMAEMILDGRTSSLPETEIAEFDPRQFDI